MEAMSGVVATTFNFANAGAANRMRQALGVFSVVVPFDFHRLLE